MTQSTARIPPINTDEFWLKYLTHGMYIDVPITGHHKKNGARGDKNWCANSLGLRDLHPDIYDVIVEREGVFVFINFKEEGKMKFALGLDLKARHIAKENDSGDYDTLNEEEIKTSIVKMIYVGSKRVRVDTPEQKEKRSKAQKARRLEEQKLKLTDNQVNGNDDKDETENSKNEKESVKAYSRTKRRPDRWAA